MLALSAIIGLSICASAQLQLYVATSGNDSNAGSSPANAFRTITKARDVLREKRPLPSGGAIVNILPGVYTGEAPIHLTMQDSGTSANSPIVYRATNVSAPTKVSGGVAIPSASWRSCSSDHAALVAAGVSLPAEVKCASLSKLGV